MTLQQDANLAEAREALTYWEQRAASLSRRDRRGRREAQEMVLRARTRVIAAERDAYGEGAVGMVTQLAQEGRFPQPVRDTGNQAVRYGRRAFVVALAVGAALLVLLVLLTVLIALVVTVLL